LNKKKIEYYINYFFDFTSVTRERKMIMNNRRVFYDESIWERFENRMKTWTYAVMHELLQN